MATAFIESRAHPAAAPFYRLFPREPVTTSASIEIEDIVTVDPMNLNALLQRIAGVGENGGDIVIVTHGVPEGLTMALVARQAEGSRRHRVSAGTDALNVLMSNRPASEKTQVLKLRDAELRSLLDGMARVRALSLACVEFRSCNVGDWSDTLRALWRFFGARTVGAPDLRDAYAFIDVGSVTRDERAWRAWHRRHPGAVLYNLSEGRFALQTTGGQEGSTRFQAQAIADSRHAVASWLREHFPPSASTPPAGSFPIHALWQSPLIFPLDSEYLDHIKRYSSADEASSPF